MAPLVLLSSVQNGDVVLAARPRLRDRLAARFRATRLDAELANGAPPSERAALAIRAQPLGEIRTRSALASGIRRALHEARDPRKVSIAQVPVHRRAVLATAEQLEQLVTRLLAPGPLSARGIAQVRLLLTDGRSPIYFGDATTEDLLTAASRALTDLHPTFAW